MANQRGVNWVFQGEEGTGAEDAGVATMGQGMGLSRGQGELGATPDMGRSWRLWHRDGVGVAAANSGLGRRWVECRETFYLILGVM